MDGRVPSPERQAEMQSAGGERHGTESGWTRGSLAGPQNWWLLTSGTQRPGQLASQRIPKQPFLKKLCITSTVDDSTGRRFLWQPPFGLQDMIFRLIIYRQHHSTVQTATMPQRYHWQRKPVLISVTSCPAPGRKLLTVIVRPGAGKGASITLRINGCTRAGDISRLFSTSSKICKKIHRTLVQCLLVSQKRHEPLLEYPVP